MNYFDEDLPTAGPAVSLGVKVAAILGILAFVLCGIALRAGGWL